MSAPAASATFMPMPSERSAVSPGDLWISAILIGAQSILYLLYERLRDPWEFYLFCGSACFFLGVFLWETRHLVRRRAFHVIHWLILADTLVEGVLQPIVRKEARANLLCDVAFAIVLGLYRLSLGVAERKSPAPAPPPAV
mgnify:CR=1 FL=1